ncbi:MAG: ATP-binding protein [Janthinobacterium lividum]
MEDKDWLFNFDISPNVVQQLGEDLVSDEVTALLELVKNSYDADADYVNVVINTQAKEYDEEVLKPTPNGFITIEDNGIGMNADDIKNGWLVISVSRKREMKRQGITTDRKRTPMGDKGLGRLSTQRLGSELEMITSIKDPHKYVVSFNWEDFKRKERLTQVPVSLSQLIKKQENPGTKLIITTLSDPNAWTGDMRVSIQNKLSQLISPFDEARAFNVFLTIDGTPFPLATIAATVRKTAASTYKFIYNGGKNLIITGKIKLSKLRVIKESDQYNRYLVADQGREFFNFITDSSNKHVVPDIEFDGSEGWLLSFKKDIPIDSIIGLNRIEFMGSSNIADPGSFQGEIDDFRIESDDITDSIFDNRAEYRDFLKRLNGIRVFRNGFGIRPFGFDGNDWMRLGSNQTSGNSFYGLRPSNVVGYVSLSGGVNDVLREKTDREGFVENEYSRNFFILMDFIRDRINNNIEAIRRAYNAFKDKRMKEESGFDSRTFNQTLDLIQTTSKEATKVEGQLEEMLSAVKETEQALNEVTTIFNNQTTSRNTSKDKDVRPAIASMQHSLAKANGIAKSTQEILGRVKHLEAMTHVLGPKINRLEQQLEDFTELAALGLVAEGFSHELVTISDNLDARTNLIEKNAKPTISSSRELRTYLEYVRMSMNSVRKQLAHLAPSLKYVREKQESISIKKTIEELAIFYSENDPDIDFLLTDSFSNFIIFGNKGRITQIIDNLVINSIYWLKEYIKNHKGFKPKVCFAAYDETLVIWDNGLGIDKTVESNLFQPFITTKPKGIGRGLGLYIVAQMLDVLNSEIILLPERNTHGRRFKFAIILKGAVKNA